MAGMQETVDKILNVMDGRYSGLTVSNNNTIEYEIVDCTDEVEHAFYIVMPNGGIYCSRLHHVYAGLSDFIKNAFEGQEENPRDSKLALSMQVLEKCDPSIIQEYLNESMHGGYEGFEPAEVSVIADLLQDMALYVVCTNKMRKEEQ